MGLEAVCVAHYGESVSEGRALLESSDLRFRGDFRLTIPFTEMRSVAAGWRSRLVAGWRSSSWVRQPSVGLIRFSVRRH